ncbi:hypothetical protein OG976_00170 [Mycobacterium sp. NBC_00419]|uniref:hypothetical protein n=1 Tax=Mycobacterium sp. NBC_00419 TaxID=2975989 RepID=UPI002E1D5987
MTDRQRTVTFALAGVAVAAAALAASVPAVAEPADPAPAPVTTVAEAPPPAPVPGDGSSMTPNQPAVAAGDPAAPPAPVFRQEVPEIANPTYGSGGGVLGSLKDLWHQAQNPYYAPDEVMGAGGSVAPPPGAGPAPALPPGYVSINAPGSETPASANQGGGSAAGRPALPPGYYSTSGPPPPGYEFAPPPGAAPATTAVAVPAQ